MNKEYKIWGCVGSVRTINEKKNPVKCEHWFSRSLEEKKVLEDEVRDAASSSQENYSLCEKLEICPAAEVDNQLEDDEKD